MSANYAAALCAESHPQKILLSRQKPGGWMDVTAAGYLLFAEESEKGQDFNDGPILFVSSSQNVFKKASNRTLSLIGSF